MLRSSLLRAAALALLLAPILGQAGQLLALRAPADSPRAPAFTAQDRDDWLNASPLRWSDLRGRVVLLDFWTFACANCFRSFGWLKSVEARYADRGLQIVGIHTPEFDFEKPRDVVVEKVREYGLQHPVMLDEGFVYWNAIGNRYWPAFYLVDRKNRIRAVYVGETHEGSEQARTIEADLETLLGEDG